MLNYKTPIKDNGQILLKIKKNSCHMYKHLNFNSIKTERVKNQYAVAFVLQNLLKYITKS